MSKFIKRHRVVRDNVLVGTFSLRVVGSEKNGFRLAGQRQDKVLYPFGQTFPKQINAIAYGMDKFNQKAVKVVGMAKAA